jgi:hypothetical protein
LRTRPQRRRPVDIDRDATVDTNGVDFPLPFCATMCRKIPNTVAQRAREAAPRRSSPVRRRPGCL